MEIVFEAVLVDTQKTICLWTWVLFFFDIVLSLVYKTFVHASVHLFASSGMACAEGIFTVTCLTGNRYKWRYKGRIRNVFLSRHYWACELTTVCHDCDVCYGLFLCRGGETVRVLHVPRGTCRVYIWQLLVDSPSTCLTARDLQRKYSRFGCFVMCANEIFSWRSHCHHRSNWGLASLLTVQLIIVAMMELYLHLLLCLHEMMLN
jgi:hypothetical protein